jgi:hypothetical protein
MKATYLLPVLFAALVWSVLGNDPFGLVVVGSIGLGFMVIAGPTIREVFKRLEAVSLHGGTIEIIPGRVVTVEGILQRQARVEAEIEARVAAEVEGRLREALLAARVEPEMPDFVKAQARVKEKLRTEEYGDVFVLSETGG